MHFSGLTEYTWYYKYKKVLEFSKTLLPKFIKPWKINIKERKIKMYKTKLMSWGITILNLHMLFC